MPSELRNLFKKESLSFVYKFPPLPQRINGKLMWVHPRALFSNSTKTFFKGEPHVRKWITKWLKPGQVFFDVGAHHGWMSMWALPLVGKEGSVYSFEPSAANLAILEWHKKTNRNSRWTIIPKAVADQDTGERRFYLIDSGDSPMNSLTSGVPGMPLMVGREVDEITIQTIALDAFCSEVCVCPSLIKIDVEGAELLVLRGAEKILTESHPTVILSVHPYWLPAGQSTQQIVELMKGYDYSIFDSKGNQVNSIRSGEYLFLARNRLNKESSKL